MKEEMIWNKLLWMKNVSNHTRKGGQKNAKKCHLFYEWPKPNKSFFDIKMMYILRCHLACLKAIIFCIWLSQKNTHYNYYLWMSITWLIWSFVKLSINDHKYHRSSRINTQKRYQFSIMVKSNHIRMIVSLNLY